VGNHTDQREERPSQVPATATQDGEATSTGGVLRRWAWVEWSVWTARMLTALEQGVKGNVWFSLIDKVLSERNLFAAARKVLANGGAPGVDHETVEAFEKRLDENVAKLSEALRKGTYQPQAIRRTYIPKPGSNEPRPLGIPTVRDRVVQGAVRHAVEPIFEKEFAEHSYGFRPRRGCKDALRRVDQLLKEGYAYVVDADLKSYFDTIPHERLMARVRERIADGRVLTLIESFLKAGILEGLKEWTPEAGVPQGAVLSPLLSNIYLDPLDHLMAMAGIEMVRYADDFVILCRTREDAEQALAMVQRWTTDNGLMLHPTKTGIVDVRIDSFEFLGYRFLRDRRYVRSKSLKKFKHGIRQETKRNNGTSLSTIIDRLNPKLRGWFGYFQHAYQNTFGTLDGWVRGRLRSLLRKRQGRRGRGRGTDHQRWPNEFFHQHGLYSLSDAHRLACQSCRG
jgi:RNA-directed DNA polymerase